MQKSKIILTDFRIEEVRLKVFKIFFYKWSNVVFIYLIYIYVFFNSSIRAAIFNAFQNQKYF